MSPLYLSCIIGPRLSESPLSEPLIIQKLFLILKSQKKIQFSGKSSNKWNTCVILRLDRLIILSQYSG